MAEPGRFKVFWAETLPGRDDVIKRLTDGGCEVILGRPFTDAARPYTDEELIDLLRDAHGALVGSRERWTRRLFESCPRLLTVAKLGIGVERIEVGAATDQAILVSHTPVPENFLSVAEHTVLSILAFAKNFKAGDRAAREGRWRGVTNVMLKGRTVGIIGVGRIGSRVAQLLRIFEVRMLGYDPFVPPAKLRNLGVEPTTLERLLRESDFVSVHAVVTRENVGMLGEQEFRLMKPTAYLINTARGALVNEGALTKALEEGWIAGAALDVFEPEPPVKENPLLSPGLEEKTIFSPHVAGVTYEAMWRMPLDQAENCIRALRGEPPEWVVNRDVVPRWKERWAAVTRR